MYKNNWKWLVWKLENLSKNGTKAIKLFSLDFYELIIDEVETHRDHVIEISSSKSNYFKNIFSYVLYM